MEGFIKSTFALFWKANIGVPTGLNRATIYMIYRGKMVFNDTTRIGSLHNSMFQEVTGGTYQLHSHGPVDEP